MASDSFTTAIFLITAIVAAAVLVNAFFPIIFTATSTFTKSSAEADERLRTDVRIINTFASAGSQSAKVWIKNVGSIRIPDTEIENADLFIGSPGDFDRLGFDAAGPDGNDWSFQILEDTNGYWDEGETIRIDCMSDKIPARGEIVYFHVVLPGGVMRSMEFTAGE